MKCISNNISLRTWLLLDLLLLQWDLGLLHLLLLLLRGWLLLRTICRLWSLRLLMLMLLHYVMHRSSVWYPSCRFECFLLRWVSYRMFLLNDLHHLLLLLKLMLWLMLSLLLLLLMERNQRTRHTSRVLSFDLGWSRCLCL